MKATISADIISSTSLSSKELVVLSETINGAFNVIEEHLSKKQQSFWGRIVKGDTIECVFDSPQYALWSALVLKVSILLKTSSWKSEADAIKKSKGFEYFLLYGIRLAIGVGELRLVDKNMGIIDGDAIYKSGRKIAEFSTSGKERIIIKDTLYFVSGDKSMDLVMNTMLSFVDVLLKKSTNKQMLVLYHKLLGLKDAEIATLLGLRVSTVNKHSTLLGWNAISEMLDFYENTNFENN